MILPVPVAARCDARVVLNRSNTGIVGSIHARGMDVCPCYFLCYSALCTGKGHSRGDPPPGSPTKMYEKDS